MSDYLETDKIWQMQESSIPHVCICQMLLSIHRQERTANLVQTINNTLALGSTWFLYRTCIVAEEFLVDYLSTTDSSHRGILFQLSEDGRNSQVIRDLISLINKPLWKCNAIE